LADRIVRTGGEAASAPTDVRRRDHLSALIKLACERYGKLDVLVNNAGVMPISSLDDLRVEDWEEMIDVNIKGVLYGIAAALPVFRTQKFGHFVNVASIAASKLCRTWPFIPGRNLPFAPSFLKRPHAAMRAAGA
jgi:NADP-dependent 3-hydroxy acid dehydrogenase YdfG